MTAATLAPPSAAQAALMAAISRRLASGPAPDPGSYALRGTAVLSLDCALTRAHDTQARAAWKLDPVRLLAGAMAAAGVPPDRLADVAERAVRFALAAAPQSATVAAEGAVKVARDAYALTAPTHPVSGATVVKGTIALISWEA